MRRALKVALWTVVGLGLLPAGALVLLDRAPGRWLAERAVERFLAGAVRIEGLEEGLLGDVRLRRLTLRDRQGTWLVASDVRLSWRPARLLHGVVHVEEAVVGDAILHRTAAGEGADGGAGGSSLRIVVDRFAVETFRLAETAPAGPAALGLAGAARLAGEDRLEAALDVKRLDAPGTATASLRLREGAYEARLALEEPGGGLLARLLRLEAAPPISISLHGQGPLDSFDLRFEAAAGEARTTGRAELRRTEEGIGFSAEASGAVAAFLPADLRPLAAEGVSLSAAGVVADDGSARLGALEARSGPISLAASGALSAEGALQGRLEASGPLAPVIAVTTRRGAGDWRFVADLAGSLDEPAARWRIELQEPRLEEIAARAIELEGEAALTADAAVFQATATADRPTAPQAPLPPTITARFAGALERSTGDFVARDVTVEGGPYALQGRGRLRASGEAAFDLTARVHDLAALGARGEATLQGRVTGQPGELEGRFDLRLAGFSHGPPALAAALGAAPQASLVVRQEGEGLLVERFAAQGAKAAIDGSGFLSGERLAAEATLRLADLAALGVPASGAARLRASLEGTPSAFAGPLSLSADFQGAQLTAQGRVSLDDKALALRALQFGGTGVSGGGELSVSRAEGLPRGRLELGIAELRPWAGLLQAPVSGALQAEARLAERGLRAELRVKELEVADVAAVAAASLEARLTDIFALRGAIVAAAENASVAGRPVRRLRVEADLADASAAFRLRGEAPEASLSGAGDVSWRDGERLTLARLEGRAAGQPFRLARAATISRQGQALALQGLDLAFGDGRLAGEARLEPRGEPTVDAARAFPLAPFLGGQAGRLDGELRLAGSAADPSATLTARLTANPAGLPEQLAKVALALRGEWRDGRVDLAAEVAGAPGTTAQARLRLPLRGDFVDWSFAVPADGAVEGGLDSTTDLAALTPFLGLDGHRLAGRVIGALRVSGTVERPAVAGEATLAGGRYDGDAFGTALRDIGLRVRGDGGRIVVEELRAADGAGGSLRGGGEIELQARRLEAGASFSRLRVAGSDELRAVASGALRLAGRFDAASLAGEIEVHEAEYAIPRRLPTRIAQLDVVEINLPPGREPRGASAGSGAGAPAFDPLLDLFVRAPGQVFVRGRGLDSEWQGEFRVGGRLSSPAVAGGLELVRGQFALAGRTLTLTGGSVTFPDRGPGEEEPELDVTASARAGEAVAELKVSGPASALEISLSSQPPLPSDEILSRLLFGTGAASLGPAQALQLAQTALELSGRGGSGGVLADVRRRFGLDFLDIETAEGGEGLDAARLRAGKYVRENVYVGVRQGARAGSSSAVVEYQFLPSLTLEGSVGADSQAGVGLNWERRY